MACHDSEISDNPSTPGALTIALAGNPNCGKTALFNILTGIRQRTGNWPGVTVDRKEGQFQIDSDEVNAVDLPGIYSLDASSQDEKVTRDYLLSGEADLIVNVVDASNLERNLYFTVQMLEMGVPLLLVLNMMDVARKRGLEIDIQRLSEELGCQVVPVVAVSGEGVTKLKGAIQDLAAGTVKGGFPLAQDEMVEQAITELESGLQLPDSHYHSQRRWLLLKMLEGDEFALNYADDFLHERLNNWREMIEDRVDEELDIHIADSRFSHAHAIAQNATRNQGRLEKTVSDRIDKVVLSRLFGIPVFLAVMYLMFMFAINIGGAFIDFFDGVAGALFVDGFGHLLASVNVPQWLVVLLADGAGGGIQVVATFIPIITALYLFLSVVEDSGYMARAAFVMDRFMR
ncbi:MAG: ferrous iron transport protein B, partial [Candidatus Thiodiazotropha sp. 6PDIVS]